MRKSLLSYAYGLVLGMMLVPLLGIAEGHAQAWAGLRVEGPMIVDFRGHNVILKGLDPGEWYNTEAYMVKWPDNDKGPVFYGASLIRKTLTDLMGRDQANEFYRRWEANIVTEEDVEKWAKWGVNSVRLSMNYHWLTSSDGVYLDLGWQRIDRFLNWCKKYHLWVILCLHAAPGSQSGELMSDGAGEAKLWTQAGLYQPWTIHLWRKIAQRYAGETAIAGYDLLDEPIPPKGHEKDVRDFYIALTKAIREVDTHHLLFVEGLEYAGSTKGMRALEPAWDGNLVFDFHKYWDKTDQASIQGYLEMRERAQRPLWNGETGENSNKWAKDMIALCEKNKIGWNWWTYKKVNGTTQAYTIHSPPGYQKILDYVGGKGPKPSRSEAVSILFSLADNAATPKCGYNAENVEAVFGKGK